MDLMPDDCDGVPQTVHLSQMPQLAEARLSEDDWTGISCPIARRRLQNRLNGRAYRRRIGLKIRPFVGYGASTADKVTQVAKCRPTHDSIKGSAVANCSSIKHKHVIENVPNQPQSRTEAVKYPRHRGRTRMSWPVLCLHCEAGPSPRITTSVVEVADQKSSKLRDHTTADEHFLTLETRTANFLECRALFPLSSDHLLSLVRYNIHRACAANIHALGLTIGLMRLDILSPFTSEEPVNLGLLQSLPPNLHPTPLQRHVPHHPYLDIFPIARIRDNLLRAGDTFDSDELCADFSGQQVESWGAGYSGVIVWGEPCHPSNWEVTQAFARKWPWIFEGCPDVLETTNYWREQRGEPRLEEFGP